MKPILLTIFVFLGFQNLVHAETTEDALSRWKLGFSFAHQPHFDHVGGIEITTPTLYGERTLLALHLNYTTRNTESNQEQTQFGADRLGLLLELRKPFYKDLISSYVRIGAGYTFIDNKAVYNGDGFFSIPVDLGFEVMASESGFFGSGYSTFFLQATSDIVLLDSEKRKTAYETTFDSTALGIGFRIYF